MTPKLKTLAAATVSAAAGIFNWLATVPPEQQSGMLAQLVDITPVAWRPNVAIFTRALYTILGFYAVYQASHSGPATFTVG